MDQLRTIRRPRGLAVLAGVGLVLAMLPALTPGAESATNRCWAKNVTRGTPARSRLQAVIDDARPGDRIKVRQVCVGHFRIGKQLTLVGERTPSVTIPVLRTNGAGRVLFIEARVTLTNLRITGGAVERGGGIWNAEGFLILNRSSVRENEASLYGGGIVNDGGTVVLNGSSTVTGNTTGGFGGGIVNDGGAVVLNDSSAVRLNSAVDLGGGIINSKGTVVMHDASSVSRNTAALGGGFFIDDGSWVTMTDSASVRGNTADEGGGIYNDDGTVTLKNASSVTGNTATDGGGILFGLVRACNGAGEDEWTGAISPNDPDDPPTVTLFACP
ncbi:MAG TPA: hypothetical protein VFI59_02860 [Actinomycetota bacterium]|nr:hypothetical protein [Actinomycetota bacterium]